MMGFGWGWCWGNEEGLFWQGLRVLRIFERRWFLRFVSLGRDGDGDTGV